MQLPLQSCHTFLVHVFLWKLRSGLSERSCLVLTFGLFLCKVLNRLKSNQILLFFPLVVISLECQKSLVLFLGYPEPRPRWKYEFLEQDTSDETLVSVILEGERML